MSQRQPEAMQTTWSRRRFLSGAVIVGALGVGAAACGGSSPSGPGTSNVRGSKAGAVASRSPSPGAVDAELIAQRYGLRPFPAAPPPPAVKPVDLNVAEPPVISHVPATDKIVFVTIDDGLEKEPAFIQMVRDFQVPFTLFLTDAIIRDDYGYFTRLLDTGLVTIQNHTLTHPDLPTLSESRQFEEIDGQQQKLTKEYGTTPYLFRPPYGDYNHDTIAAVKETPGLKGVVMWKETMQISDMQYQGAHLLHPGDIILSHFRGPAELRGETMVGMMKNLFKHVQAQGFTIARLTDYV